MAENSKLTFNSNLPQKIFYFLFGFEVLLVILDATINYNKVIPIGAIRRFCNLAREDGFGTWFASTQALLVGLTAISIHFVQKTNSKKSHIGWLIIGLFFIYLAADDAALIHERVGTTLNRLMNDPDSALSFLRSFPTYTWHIIFFPVFGGFGLFLLFFLMKELNTKHLRFMIFLALSLYTLAVGIDFLEGFSDGEYFRKATNFLSPKGTQHFAKVFEEFLEMLGTTYFLTAFLKYLVQNSQQITVIFKENK